MPRTIAPWIAWTLLASAGASAQSLAEVAAKERERRQRSGGEPIRVIDERTLESGAPAASAESSPVVEPASDEGPELGDEAAAREPAEPPLSAAEVREYRVLWARVWAEQMARAQDALERAEHDMEQCRAASHYAFVPLAIDCNGVRERRARAAFRLEQTRRNRYNWELLLPQRSRAPPLY